MIPVRRPLPSACRFPSRLMFRRGSDYPGFRGTMTLSTYPLITWQQDWTFFQRPESWHSHRIFSDGNSEGIYLASRFLINLQDSELAVDNSCDTLSLMALDTNCPKEPRAASSVLVQDYGLPSWLVTDAAVPTHPPTWLSVVGGGQVWPVATLDETTLPESLPAPAVEYGTAGDGRTRFGEYYVRASYVDALGRASVLSAEHSIWICPEWLTSIHPGCNTLEIKAPPIPPSWATKYRIYIGGTPGSETLQAEKPIGDSYIQSGRLSPVETVSAGYAAPDRSLLSPVYTDAPPNSSDLMILPISIRICFSILFLWALWHLYCCWNGSQTGFPHCRAFFAPMRGPQHNVLIFFGCFLIVLAAIVMATFTGGLGGGASPFMHPWRMTFLYEALAVLSLAALTGNNPEFCHQYEEAKDIQTELSAEDLVNIADKPLIGETRKDGPKGLEITVGDNVARSRLKIETRKWVAMKLLPKRYGDSPRARADQSTTEAITQTIAEKIETRKWAGWCGSVWQDVGSTPQDSPVQPTPENGGYEVSGRKVLTGVSKKSVTVHGSKKYNPLHLQNRYCGVLRA